MVRQSRQLRIYLSISCHISVLDSFWYLVPKVQVSLIPIANVEWTDYTNYFSKNFFFHYNNHLLESSEKVIIFKNAQTAKCFCNVTDFCNGIKINSIIAKIEHTENLMLHYLVAHLLLIDGGNVSQKHCKVVSSFFQNYPNLFSFCCTVTSQ